MLTESTRSKDFPALAGRTYLNTAAESVPPLCVGEAIQSYWQDKLSGMDGRQGHFAAVEACREVSARMVGLSPDEVSFCSCSSEAYNLFASALDLGKGDEVVVSDLDFPAGATPWLRSPGARAPDVRVWPSVDGVLDIADLIPILGENTRLVQISLISFYNGHRIDWKPFQELVRRLAPAALISVDVTQALGRVVLDCEGADLLISSTHKWTLGIHGGCVIGIPRRNAQRLTTHAGGWYHLNNAFDADRFERAESKTGAASFSVGMPNFVSLYALDAALRYLESIGIEAISAHADPLVARVHEGLRELGIHPLCPPQPHLPGGIVAFRHRDSAALHAALVQAGIHVMHHAGRIRIAVHGYNTSGDIDHLLATLRAGLRTVRPD